MNPEDDPRVTALIAELRRAASATPDTDHDEPMPLPDDDPSPTVLSRDERPGRYSDLPTEHFADGAPPRSRSSPSQGNQVSLAHQTRLVEEVEHVRDAVRGVHHQLQLITLVLDRLHGLVTLALWVPVAVAGTGTLATLAALVGRYLVWG